jgi:hypothetical protein
MEESKQPKTDPGQPLSPEQTASISGGADSCPAPTTATVGPVTQIGTSPGQVLTDIYDGFVEVTSHIIERVVTSMK